MPIPALDSFRRVYNPAMNPTSPPASRAPTEPLSGAVERVTYHSPESGFCVLRVQVRGQRDLVTLIGSAASVSPGEHLEAEGHWVNDRQHGLQSKATNLRIVPPRSLEGIERYLGSGMVKGIGPHFARTLSEHGRQPELCSPLLHI